MEIYLNRADLQYIPDTLYLESLEFHDFCVVAHTFVVHFLISPLKKRLN